MRESHCYLHIDVPAHETIAARKVHYAIVFGTRGKLTPVLPCMSGDQYALDRADHAFATFAILRVDVVLQPLEPLLCHGKRHGVGKLRRRRSGARAVEEAEAAVESDIIDEVERLAKVGFGLPWKSDDKIR